MFIPTGAKNGPNVNELDRVRVTDIRYCDDDKTETVRDQWMSSGVDPELSQNGGQAAAYSKSGCLAGSHRKWK